MECRNGWESNFRFPKEQPTLFPTKLLPKYLPSPSPSPHPPRSSMSTANPLDSMKEIEAALRTCTPSQTLTMVSMEIAKIKRRIVRDMKIAGMRVDADVISHYPQQSYGRPLASHMHGGQRRGSHGSQSSPESEKCTAEECVACLLNALFIAMAINLHLGDTFTTIPVLHHVNLQGLSLAIQRSPEGVVPSLLFVNISDLVGRIVAKVESMQIGKNETIKSVVKDTIQNQHRPSIEKDFNPPGITNPNETTSEWINVKDDDELLKPASISNPSSLQKTYFDADKNPGLGGVPNLPSGGGGMLMGPDAPIFQPRGSGGGMAPFPNPPGFGGPPGFGAPRGPAGGFGFDGRIAPGMQPRYDPMMPPGVGPRGPRGGRMEDVNNDALKPPSLPDNNMFM
ncbi:hypothetical protein TL16_g00311 [Triparma laevis f. inornata]|uniref:Uncharacterized protein n=1 Tax=Triparma laevis f. inornata TaxID=1714386 RepID=A0A9W6ZCC9_9STRA|nr:hypothetical protein TL16_g00311 [Triparma laevis f. inornata]